MLRQLKQTASWVMQTNVRIKAHWPHPGQQTAGKDNLRGGLIPMRAYPHGANMLTLRQGFLGHCPADRACFATGTPSH